jgi:hypothetical protein
MKNQPAFPTTVVNGYKEGLTKLEYFSIECLKGILSNPTYTSKTENNCSRSIEYAKELLKQLENE